MDRNFFDICTTGTVYIIKQYFGLRNGMKSLLRNEIIRIYEKYSILGFCPSYMKENINEMYTNYHKLPEDYYTTWQVQVELCYQKWKEWTKFYWPSRIVKGKRCSEYVKDRFTYIE